MTDMKKVLGSGIGMVMAFFIATSLASILQRRRKVFRFKYFTMSFSRMELGWTMVTTGTFGFPVWKEILLRMRQTVIGSIQNMEIHGCLIIPGVGLHFIMVAGSGMIFMVGYGYPIRSGLLPGLRGEAAAATMVGRH